MRVLVACEFSGRVRDAFTERGHDAVSCDFLPSETEGKHYQGDMFDLNFSRFDLIIAHPPCTAICVSGNRYYSGTQERLDGASFISKIWSIPVDRLVIENPVGVINTLIPEMPVPEYIQPWQFGHGETKKTGLWLRGVSSLSPTDIVEGRKDRVHKMSPSAERSKLRSITYQGIADAMAHQWGNV